MTDTGPGARPQLGAGPTAVLDTIERCIRGIHHPVDLADCFHVQCHLALEAAGLYAVTEAPMPGQRRVDLVVVGAGGTYAIELDRFKPRPESLGKFRDMPEAVVRVLVLRRRNRHNEVVPHVDRVICVESSLRPLSWLTDGSGVPVEESPDLVRRFIDARKAEAEPGWRHSLLMGPRKGPRPAAVVARDQGPSRWAKGGGR